MAQTFSTYRQQALEALRNLAASLSSRRKQDDSFASDQVKQATEETLVGLGAPKIAEPNASTDGEGQDERWKVDAMQNALTRSFEVLVDEAASDETAEATQLSDTLDVVLSAAELGYVDDTLPLTILTNVLELRPVSECEPVLAYIESRIKRLTKGMEYQRGRGPILLRLLNDLLRRLPRSQSHSVILSGRILTLLSWVYPLNEKSGVNLRGNFNVGKGFSFEEPEKQVEGEGEGATTKEGQAAKMEVEEGEEAEESKQGAEDPAAFYSTFWSLQRYFINPELLSKPASAASSSSSSSARMPALRDGVRKTLTAFNAATKKAKDLAGSAKEVGAAASARQADKAKKDGDDGMDETDLALEEYFFPKFLTSPDLLELELADPSFRRQILVQVLILFHYLLGFTPAERTRVEKLPQSNMSAYPTYVLSSEDETWIRELRSRILDELDAMEGGRRFRKAVQLVLQRDQNWIDWKIRSCPSFILEPLDAAALSEKARNKLRAVMRKPKRFPYRLGNANLSRTWEKNLTSLDGFEPNVDDDELEFILREYRLEKNRLKQTEAQLARAAPGGAQRSELENTLEAKRTRLQALHWRSIRSASTQHLRFFSQIGAGDLEKLEQLIDEDARRREEEAEAAEANDAPDQQPSGYDSDSSVLEMTPKPKVAEPEPKKEEAEAEAEAAQKEEENKSGDEAGTPPPPATPAEKAAESIVVEVDDEPGTPPPKAAVASPGTPKRPREEEEEDAAMTEGETAAKRLKVE